MRICTMLDNMRGCIVCNCLVPQRNSEFVTSDARIWKNRDFFRCVKVHGIRCSDSDNGFHVFYFLMLTSQECSSIDISLIRLLLPFGSIGKNSFDFKEAWSVS